MRTLLKHEPGSREGCALTLSLIVIWSRLVVCRILCRRGITVCFTRSPVSVTSGGGIRNSSTPELLKIPSIDKPGIHLFQIVVIEVVKI
jgi:hypothetical protein